MSKPFTAALVTYETVAQAAEAINQDSKRPSVRAVIAYLGGGSPNAVLGFLQQWKAGRPLVKADEIQVDPRIGQIVAEQIAKTVGEARAEIEARLADMEQDAEAVAKAGREAEERAEDLAVEIELAKGQIQTQAGQIEQLKVDADQVKADAVAKVKAAEERAAGDVAQAQEQAKREQEAREAAQVALAKAELRLEALPRLEKEIERLQLALDAERTARTDAERQVAAAVAKSEGLEARLADAQMQHKRVVDGLESQLKDQKQRSVEAIGKLEEGLAARLADVQEQHKRTVEGLESQLKDQKQRSGEVIGKLENDKQRKDGELAEARKEGKQTAAQIGKLEGQIEALQKQLAALASPPADGGKTKTTGKKSD